MFGSGSQILTGDYDCEDIAGHMYLWTPKYSGMRPDRMIITAHGERGTTSTFTVRQDTRLKFYSQDAYSVNDPGLRRFYENKQNAIPIETLGRGDRCYNYILTKYTNSEKNTSHNNAGETYSRIQNIMAMNYKSKAIHMRAIANDLATAHKFSQPFRQLATKYDNVRPACILTIRYRRFRTFVNLKWALQQLEKRGYVFNTVDCLFCRTNFWNGARSLLGFGSYSQDVQYK